MNIKEKLSHSSNFRVGRREAIQYIVIHYTAGNGDTAWGNANFFQNNVIYASANYFVDEFDIYCSVKPENTSWHCGGDPYPATRPSHYGLVNNDNSISVELCSQQHDDANYYISQETREHAVEFVRYLMNLYDIDIHHVVRHYDVTGKPCPEPFLDTIDWEWFLEDIIDMTIDTLNNYEKVQYECGLEDSTMEYLMDYTYGPELIKKIADAI